MTDTTYRDDANDTAQDTDAFGLDDPERELSSTVALFEGDEGGLELAQRRALVVLLKKRFISNQADPKEWKALMANPRVIRARLNDLFMDLHMDTDREVAYKRQVAPEGGGRPFPTLLYDTAWGREDTLLLVYLRTRTRHEQAGGADRVFVDRVDMLEFIAQHRPERATDQAGDAKRAAKAIESLTKAGLLLDASTSDRYEVSSAIEVLLPMEKLNELLTWLKEQNNPTDPRLLDAPDENADENAEDEQGDHLNATTDDSQD